MQHCNLSIYLWESFRCVSISPVRSRLCSLCLVMFCDGACDVLAQLVGYHEAFNPYPEALHEHPHQNRVLPEQKAARDILDRCTCGHCISSTFRTRGERAPLMYSPNWKIQLSWRGLRVCRGFSWQPRRQWGVLNAVVCDPGLLSSPSLTSRIFLVYQVAL